MYGDFAMMVDHEIGRVLKSIESHDMNDNTLVIFSSDNGPVWYQEDVKRFDHDSSGGLRGMKSDAWECGHRMPFIARWPAEVAAGSTSDQLVCFTDLLATFAGMLGVELPKSAGPDSFDFSPVLLGEPAESPLRSSLVMRSGGGLMTVRDGDWKLIDGLGSGGFSVPRKVKPGLGDPKGQLYNLKTDLGETQNLYQAEPQVVAELTTMLKSISTANGHRFVD